MFDDKAPRRTLWLVVFLTTVLVCSVTWGALRQREVPATLEPCALVVSHEGSTCQ